jgi:DNA-binding MarR family transcriptional regulator
MLKRSILPLITLALALLVLFDRVSHLREQQAAAPALDTVSAELVTKTAARALADPVAPAPDVASTPMVDRLARLAGALSCDASNVTGLIDRLEARGLVQRRPAPQDRRVKVLDLTPVGVRVRAQLLNRTRHRSHPMSRLSTDEQRTLIRLLEKLLEDPPA